ncbi:hypothetical protein HanLR1_Chr05g0185381 [Helianthus annuus]|nr:hypothetical protein HanLR1_Chr05g0185381 [Helianthus annuus]
MEAVALPVLIGEESNKSCVPALMHKEEEEWHPWGYGASNFGLFMGDSHARTTATVIPHSRQLLGIPNGDTCWFLMVAPYVMERDWEAAKAISSLQIADDGVNAFVFNRMMRG